MSALIPPNTCIAALAPSSAYNPDKFEFGLNLLRNRGFNIEVFPDAPAPHRYLAGADAFRAGQLTEAFTNPKYGAVWAIRGGYGMTRILSQLHLNDFQAKPLIGFSDIVALQIPLAAMGFPVVHGPVIHSLCHTDEASIEHLLALLSGAPTAPLEGDTWVSGNASGPIVGGNLCMLAAMCGTPWSLDTRGTILVLEDIGEYVYRIDRLLQQIKSSGLLDNVAGIAIGEFTDCPAPDNATFTVTEVLQEYVENLGVPVLGALPIGHATANRAFQWNQIAKIEDGHLHLSI